MIDSSRRDLDGFGDTVMQNPGLTIESCLLMCVGFKYAGVQGYNLIRCTVNYHALMIYIFNQKPRMLLRKQLRKLWSR